LFTVHDLCSVLPATGKLGFGVYNQTSISVGYGSRDVDVSLGPSFSVYSLPACGLTLCGRVVGLAPGGHAQANVYWAGPLGVSVSASVDWVGGQSLVLTRGLGRDGRGWTRVSMEVEMNAYSVLGIAALVPLMFAACNYTDGECFPRDQLYETAGAGGGVIVPTGVGGYGDVPKEPQGAPGTPPPVCNIVSGGPCDEKCQADYDAASLECGKIEDTAQRSACQDKAHASYKTCEEKCEQTPKSTCDLKYQDCASIGPYGCLKRVGSQTLCQRCWERCNAGDPPSPECSKCRF
jgi:hypothetical protein